MTKEQETAMIRGVWIGALGTAAGCCLWLFLSSVAFSQEPAPAEPKAQVEQAQRVNLTQMGCNLTPRMDQWVNEVILTHRLTIVKDDGIQCLGWLCRQYEKTPAPVETGEVPE